MDTEKMEKAALIVTAMGARSDNSLEEALKQLTIPHMVVGDAKSPRRILEAIHEGHKAGEEI
jgi:2,4-dienoyl-CoA reductase (NADPH2)